MPTAPFRVPFRNVSPCLFTVMVVAVNVAVHPLSHSCPMDISAPGWRWGEMCSVLALVEIKGLSWSPALCFSCMMLPSGRITRGPCVVLTLFLQGVCTLM